MRRIIGMLTQGDYEYYYKKVSYMEQELNQIREGWIFTSHC